jgi:hypothetical protein
MTGGTAGEIRLGRELVEQVARELAGDGYEVLIEPGPSFLPGKLARFRPDILARRGDENLVVEVKLTPDPAGGGEMRELAEAVRERPGWRFRLATAPRDLAAAPWTIEEAAQRVDEAEALGREGHAELAVTLLVAAAEAVGRRLGRSRSTSPALEPSGHPRRAGLPRPDRPSRRQPARPRPAAPQPAHARR